MKDMKEFWFFFSICLLYAISEAESKSSVQYFYYKAKHFEHFHYVYNLTRDCYDRILKRLRRTNDRRNCMADDVVIKIGVVGEFSEEKLNFLSQRRGKVFEKIIGAMLRLPD